MEALSFFVCIYICMYGCMYIYVCVCMCTYVCRHAYAYTHFFSPVVVSLLLPCCSKHFNPSSLSVCLCLYKFLSPKPNCGFSSPPLLEYRNLIPSLLSVGICDFLLSINSNSGFFNPLLLVILS